MIYENIAQLKMCSGPFFEYWRYRTASKFRYVLLDDPPQERQANG